MRHRQVHRFIAIGMIVSTLWGSGCVTTEQNSNVAGGAVLGALVGAAAGYGIDHRNRERGAIIGAIGGATIGMALTHRMNQAAARAAQSNETVVIENDNDGEVIAVPLGREGDMRIVELRHMRDGQVIHTETRRIPIG